jgi:hypothetical protein
MSVPTKKNIPIATWTGATTCTVVETVPEATAKIAIIFWLSFPA